MTDSLKRNANLVEALGSALREGGHALGTVPGLIKRVLVEESWREFVTQRGEHVEHARFVDFVVTPPLKGIGADPQTVRKLIADDPEALSLYDQAMQNPHGGDRSKSNNVPLAPAGNSRQKALRRLRKDAPELHADVVAGRLTAHGAMVKAGYRPRTTTVRTDSPAQVAAALRRALSPEDLAQVIKLLLYPEGSA